jgi:hypothetical protein
MILLNLLRGVDWDLQSRQSLFSSSTLHRQTLSEGYKRSGLDMRRIRGHSKREEQEKRREKSKTDRQDTRLRSRIPRSINVHFR